MKIKLLYALAVVSAVFVGCKKNNDGDSVPVRPGETINRLDKNGPANCYIVTKPGQYFFLPVKGNSNESVGDLRSAKILWESFGTSETPNEGDVIGYCGLDLSQGDDALVMFSAPSPLRNGNAVIAVRDATLNILWSWHIWVCADYDPEASAQIYYGNAGTVMDRNLGATSATPGDVGALGLMYQWGRKDPFLGGNGIMSSTRAASTGEWPEPVASGSGKNKQYALEHPMVFITNDSGSDRDWNCDGDGVSRLWYKPKSVDDPCPHGWRVPEGYTEGLWQTAINSLQSPASPEVDDVNRGVNFFSVFGSSDTIWYPAAGFINNVNGVINDVGNRNYTWSITNSDHKSYFFGFDMFAGTYENPDRDTDYRSYGHSVRCVKE